MSGFRLKRAAQRDLSSIWDFTEKHWDIRQAEKYIREIRHAIERVAADPDRGRRRVDRVDLRANGRAVKPVGALLVPYRAPLRLEAVDGRLVGDAGGGLGLSLRRGERSGSHTCRS